MNKSAYLPLAILSVDLIDVDVQAHELGETLLPHESLSLQVALLNGLGGQHARSKQQVINRDCTYFSILVHLPMPNFIKASLRQWTS